MRYAASQSHSAGSNKDDPEAKAQRETHPNKPLKYGPVLKMKSKPYNENKIKFEKDYVLKKLDITNEDFDKLMKENPKKHTEYKTDQYLVSVYNFFKLFKK